MHSSDQPTPSIDQQPIGDWLEQLAAKAPTPGGGAVAALVGAVASALGSMVVAYTLGKKAFAEVEPELVDAAKRLDKTRLILLTLADEDARAYAALNAMMRLPEDDAVRIKGWADAVRDAIDVPRAGVAASASLASLLEGLLGKSNRWLGSDLAIAAELAGAAASAFAWNVRVNLPQLEDTDQRSKLEAEALMLVARARASAQAVAEAVADQIGD